MMARAEQPGEGFRHIVAEVRLDGRLRSSPAPTVIGGQSPPYKNDAGAATNRSRQPPQQK
jgi:hypothetical protein